MDIQHFGLCGTGDDSFADSVGSAPFSFKCENCFRIILKGETFIRHVEVTFSQSDSINLCVDCSNELGV